MADVALTRGLVAVVDDADLGLVGQFNWRVLKGTRSEMLYAYRRLVRCSDSKHSLMHRMIMDAPPGVFVDHIDGNGLNNRRSNLRLCSKPQNLWNRGKQSDNTSGFKGVTRLRGRWQAQISVNRRYRYLGLFDTPEAAYAAYCAAARELHGEFVNLGEAAQ